MSGHEEAGEPWEWQNGVRGREKEESEWFVGSEEKSTPLGALGEWGRRERRNI